MAETSGVGVGISPSDHARSYGTDLGSSARRPSVDHTGRDCGTRSFVSKVRRHQRFRAEGGLQDGWRVLWVAYARPTRTAVRCSKLEQDVGALPSVWAPLEAPVMHSATRAFQTAVNALPCHQIPDRCFHLRGQPMPVCARCLGAGIGQVISLPLFLLGFAPAWWLCVLGVIALGVDWSLQQWAGVMSTNWRRLATGTAAGVAIGTFYWYAFAQVAGFLAGAW